MMDEDGGPPTKRVKMNRDDLERLSKEELMERWIEQESLVEALLSKQGNEMVVSRYHDNVQESYQSPGREPPTGPLVRSLVKITTDLETFMAAVVTAELTGLRESGERLKLQQVDATRRENVLVMRLTNKEQQLQEYLNQIQGLKQAQTPSMTQLRAMLLDPAVNLLFQRMKQEVDTCKERLEQAQNDLAAWKFTPDSQTGKRLMAKCRMLLQENEELGKINSSGRTAKLEGEIALQKKFVEEMKSSSAETDEFLVEMDEDVEGMQGTIYLLQQQLKENKVQLAQLQEENQRLQSINSAAASSTAAVSSPPNTNPTAGISNTDQAAHESVTTVTPTPDDMPQFPHTGNATCSSSHTDSISQQADRTEGVTRTEGVPRTYNVTPPQPHTNYQGSGGSQEPQPVDEQPTQTNSVVTASNGDHQVTSTDTVSYQTHSDQLQQPMEQECEQADATETSDYHNHLHITHYRTAQSDICATDGTDLSSEAWSPLPIKQTVLPDDEQSRIISSGSRTEIKMDAYGNEAVQNGLLGQVYEPLTTDNNT